MELLEIVKKTINTAQRMGASQADAIAMRRHEISIHGTNDKIGGLRERRAESEISKGLGVRIVIKKSLAYGYTTVLDENSIIDIVKRTVKIAERKKPDEDFKTLPKPKKPPIVEGIFDKKIVNPPIEETFEILRKNLEETMEANEYFNTVRAGYTFIWGETAIANTLGIEEGYRESAVAASIYIVGEKNGLRISGWESDAKRSLNEVSIDYCRKEAIKYAEKALTIAKINGGEMTVIFQPSALTSLMNYAFIRAIDAYNVQEGKSYLANKLGKEVAAEKLTIIDDGLYSKGLRTSPIDDEGTPSQRTIIVENGVLKSYIYDSYTAYKEGRESTGNASRSFRSSVTISPRNQIVQGEETKIDELIGDVKEGLLVRGVMGAHSTNIATGAFSIVASPAYAIRKGEIIGQVKGCMIAGTFADILKNYEAQGDDKVQKGFLIAPSIRFRKVRVTV
ncbi:MAG: TldD/PmbA family protein [archaeon GB-1867-097]|nr:TldD/PmbA family protein [Candidatus Culexmicrobium thermophilum]MCS7384530.1 TldD/PmbA family protein [Candidatus Culexmicrobium thermophilum]RLE55014.1 MAG: hypothetical protein DRJ30_04380 [Candidatus Verstraetearchaeota archaeon]